MAFKVTAIFNGISAYVPDREFNYDDKPRKICALMQKAGQPSTIDTPVSSFGRSLKRHIPLLIVPADADPEGKQEIHYLLGASVRFNFSRPTPADDCHQVVPVKKLDPHFDPRIRAEFWDLSDQGDLDGMAALATRAPKDCLWLPDIRDLLPAGCKEFDLNDRITTHIFLDDGKFFSETHPDVWVFRPSLGGKLLASPVPYEMRLEAEGLDAAEVLLHRKGKKPQVIPLAPPDGASEIVIRFNTACENNPLGWKGRGLAEFKEVNGQQMVRDADFGIHYELLSDASRGKLKALKYRCREFELPCPEFRGVTPPEGQVAGLSGINNCIGAYLAPMPELFE